MKTKTQQIDTRKPISTITTHRKEVHPPTPQSTQTTKSKGQHSSQCIIIKKRPD